MNVAQKSISIDTEKISHMQFTRSLLQHLDKVYGKMIAKEMFSGQDELMVEGLEAPQSRSYYNPGNSNVTASF